MKCTQVAWHGLSSVYITQTAIARNPLILLGTEDSQFLGSFPWKALDVWIWKEKNLKKRVRVMNSL